MSNKIVKGIVTEFNHVKNIVADFETCKEAKELGLKIETVFGWDDVDKTIDTYDFMYHNIPAPTSEEIKLPHYNEMPIEYIGYQIVYHDNYILFQHEWYDGLEVFHVIHYRPEENIVINEATARLKMHIWICKNKKEMLEWYYKKNMLVRPTK